jgi:hypothetical protein
MNITVSIFLAALAILMAVGLVLWGWYAMARVEEELKSFSQFEGLDFET